MKKKLTRAIVWGGAGVLALAFAGYAFGGGNAGSSHDGTSTLEPAITDGYDGSDDVMSSIDRALGRESTLVKPEVGSSVAAVPPAPAVAPRTGAAEDVAKAAQNQAYSTSGAAVGAPAPLGGGPTGGSGVTGAQTATDDRKIVQTASISLQVKDVGGSFEEVSRIATGAGGFVASSQMALKGEDQIGTLTIRVPATRYQDVLNEVRHLGAKIDNENSNASDVTDEYSDLTARQRNLEATEQSLLTLLSRANNVSEVLQVQDRLNSVRTQIDQTKGRMALLDKLSDLATLTVHLRPVVATTGDSKPATGLEAKINEAWDSSIDFLEGIAGGVLTIVVFAWWLPVVGVPAYLIATRMLRRKDGVPARIEGV